MFVCFCALMVGLIRGGEGGTTTAVPIYTWPLNGVFRGMEARTSLYSLNPDQDHHIQVISNGNPRLNEKSTLQFNGTNYIDVAVSGDHEFQEVAISFYLQAVNANKAHSVFLHYKSTNTERSKIHEIILEGQYGDLVATTTLGDGSIAQIKCPNDFYKSGNIFFLGTYVHSSASGKASMYFDWNHKHDRSSPSSELSVPGVLRFGNHQTESSVGYVGQLSCASMFNCGEDIDATYYTTICNSFTSPPSTEPTLIWPLDNKAYGYEVKTDIKPTYHTFDPPRFLQGPNELANQALMFDGSRMSSITSSLPTSMLIGQEYSLAIYIHLANYNNGKIIYTKHDSIGILLSVQNSTFSIEFFDDNEAPCTILTLNKIIETLKWHVLIIKRSVNNIYIGINDEEFTYNNGCHQYTGPIPITKMELTFGVRAPMEEGFKGGLRCLALFEFIRPIAVLKQSMKNACNSNLVSGISRPAPVPVDTKRDSRSSITGINLQPPTTVTRLRNFVSKSLTSCGKGCLETPYCRSYSFGVNNNCIYFDTLMTTSLSFTSGIKYYVLNYE